MIIEWIIIIVSIIIPILIWTKWMKITKQLFLKILYLKLTPYLTYFQTKAIFENLFYCIFGIIVFIFLSLSYQINWNDTFYFKIGDITSLTLRILSESISLFAVISSSIFISTSLVISIIKSKNSNNENIDFSNSWMETYIKLKPIKLSIIIAFLPILSEELVFRALLNSALLNTINDSNDNYIIVIAFLSTFLFIIQQIKVLNNKIQMLIIGIASFWIGIVNSIAFLQNISFYSILLSHYFFVLLMIISLTTKTRYRKHTFQ
jgi:hypothetical protein